MKCPKCGYHSFEHLDRCKKCGHDLDEHKAKFNLHGFFAPRPPAAAPEPVHVAVGGPENGDSTDPGAEDLGPDLHEEEGTSLSDLAGGVLIIGDRQPINIDQPFSVDGETIPADTPGSMSKSRKGPGFIF